MRDSSLPVANTIPELLVVISTCCVIISWALIVTSAFALIAFSILMPYPEIRRICFWVWSIEIQNAIETAQMTICLISKHFLASDYIQKGEIPEILLCHKEGMI